MPTEPDDRPLFGGLVLSDPQKRPRSKVMLYSVAGHVLVVVVAASFAIFGPDEMPHTDPIKVLLYNPPPPPPPPLPKGSPLVREKKAETKPTTPEEKPDPEKITAPDERPKETELKPETKVPEDQQAGSETGSDLGTPEGMESGVEGGQVGGVPGGVLGGIIGGTGDVVPDYDAPPRPISLTRPVYPHDAFVKKLEGTVHVGIIIEVDGRIRRAGIVKSIPALDAAALAAVRTWVFQPAMKHGRPVATYHVAPVTFRIF